MGSNVRGIFSVFIGSLVIALGSTIAGISSFNRDVELVTVGFMIFVAGYAISQHGLHPGGGAFRLTSAESKSLAVLALQIVLLIVGVSFISVGVTMFSQTILDPNLNDAVISGISSIGGYMIAHVGINREGIGESLIYRPVETITSLVRRQV